MESVDYNLSLYDSHFINNRIDNDEPLNDFDLLVLQKVDIAMITFSMIQKYTLKNLEKYFKMFGRVKYEKIHKKSFDLLHENEQIWFIQNLHIILVANKCDMDESIDMEYAKQLSVKYKTNFFEISARTRKNVLEAFTTVIENFSKGLPYVDTIEWSRQYFSELSDQFCFDRSKIFKS